MKKNQKLQTPVSRKMRNCLFPIVLALVGCTGAGESPIDESDNQEQVSDTEITLKVDGWEPLTESRATLFDQDNFFDSNPNDNLKPGGNFTLNGYLATSGAPYLVGARGWYFSDTDNPEWRFRSDKTDSDGKLLEVTFPTYYWPNSDKVNFFAYMPYKDYSGNLKDYVEIGTYKGAATGHTFSCNLPENNTLEAEQIEFIYAYEENQSREQKTLHLHFKHPFALVQFKLASGSYRMTVKSIELGNIYLDGTFHTVPTPAGKWEKATDATLKKYTATINKRIPTEINYNTVFGGPYLMMPQDLASVTLTLDATRSIDKGQTTETTINKTIQLKDIEDSPTIWEPGKIYTYILSMGDNNEEIYFNVKVEDSLIQDWVEEGKYEANVE